MLEFTETATDVIGEITDEPDLPDTAGLRITSDADADGGQALAAVLTEGPGAEDEVLESGQGPVYVDPAVADHLADRVLDAEKDAEGEIVFHVRRQTEA